MRCALVGGKFYSLSLGLGFSDNRYAPPPPKIIKPKPHIPLYIQMKEQFDSQNKLLLEALKLQ